MAKLFGFSIDDNDKLASSAVSPVPQNNEDGVDHYLTSGFFGAYVDIEGVYRTEFDMIKRYREMALHPEVDGAIEDIVNEAIVSDTNDSPIKIELSNLNASDGIKEKIREEFKYILEMLDFDRKSHEIYRNWYVDGRLYYHKVIDFKNPKDGIQELRYIDAMKMRYVRKQKKKKGEPNNAQILRVTDNPMDFDFPDIEEYFLFDPKASYPVGAMGGQNLGAGGTKGAVPIARDAVTYCTSGLVDRNKGITLSYLHKAIKSLNQLRMIEDSLVIYRLSRAPERRIFYIDVGNLPKVKAEQYLRDVMMRYRNKLTYNACLAMDTQIPLLDGRTLTLEQITEEFNKGERLWAYSCDPNTGKFAPGIISWAGVTRKNEKVMRITLDNDKTITCTLDHKFPTWNKGIVEAQNLEVGDSMIPFYSKGDGSYSQIYENESKAWKFVHRLVSDWKEEKGLANGHTAINTIVLHKNLDNHNNNPENIIKLHHRGFIESKDDSTVEVSNLAYRNHKIAKIEFLDVTMDVGTLSIDNEEQYHNHHTFALDCGIYTCNSTGELQTDKKFMSMLEDFWLPRREGGRGTEITTLPGGQNLGEITDIKYFQEKLYRSLNVPPTRIGGEGGFNLGRSSEILRDELKFTKFVGRLRKRFSNMFNDMLKTQLILKNIITPEDWKEMREHIQYDFLYDNHFSELKEAELMTERLNMAATAEPYIGKYYSQDYVRRRILRQTDEEIVEQDILIKKEIERGVIPDPNAQIDPSTGLPMTGQQQPPQDNIQGASGDVPIDPQSADDKAVEITKDKPL